MGKGSPCSPTTSQTEKYPSNEVMILAVRIDWTLTSDLSRGVYGGGGGWRSVSCNSFHEEINNE